MAQLGQINFNEVHASDELLPAGEYTAMIVASGARPEDPQTKEGYVISKSGKGAYLPFTFEIIDGEFKGRQVRKNFNLQNANKDAERIAQQEMKQLLVALNWPFDKKPYGPEDTSELYFIPLVVKIAQVENRQTGNLQNEIKKFIMQGGGTAHIAQPVAAPIGTSPMAKPWERKPAVVSPPQPASTETPKE